MNNNILKNLKLLKGISEEDTVQDDLLKLIIEQSIQAVRSYINRRRDVPLEELPEELEWLILEVSVKRFNRINSEGMVSKSEEGSKLEWSDLLEEHEADLLPYTDEEKDKSKRGVFRVWGMS